MIKLEALSTYEMALLVFITQILFLWFRTLNLKYVQNDKILMAIVTSNCIAITWLVSVTIGVSALLGGEPLPIIAHLAGGSLGTYLGMRK